MEILTVQINLLISRNIWSRRVGVKATEQQQREFV